MELEGFTINGEAVAAHERTLTECRASTKSKDIKVSIQRSQFVDLIRSSFSTSLYYIYIMLFTRNKVSVFLATTLAYLPLSQACMHHYMPPLSPPSDVDVYRNSSLPSQIRTALVNVRPFDGYEILAPQTIYIENGTIVPYISSADRVVDGKGGVLLPGLIDSHCHPGSIIDLENLSSYGVTTAMMMSCANYTLCHALKDQSNHGLTSSFFAGHPAQGPNSTHAIHFKTPPENLIYGPSQAQSFADQVFGNGSDYLKITAEINGPSLETQTDLVAETHKHGKKSMTHAAFLEYYEQAIMSKSDGIQHAPGDGTLSSTMLELMISQRQFATPTMEVARLMLAIRQYNASVAESFGVTPNETYALWKSNVVAMHEAGVPILAGTDSAGVVGLNVSTFGWTVHMELENLVSAGLSNDEALRSATLLPSLLHDLSDRGRVETGFRADLLLLEPGANPLNNITDTRKIQRVWNAGIEYEKVANQSVFSTQLVRTIPP